MFLIRKHKTIIKAILFRKVIRPILILLTIVWLLYFWINFKHNQSLIFTAAKILPLFILLFLLFVINTGPNLKIPIEEDTRTGILILRSFLDMDLQTYKTIKTNHQDSGIDPLSGYLIDESKPYSTIITKNFHYLKDIESNIWKYARVIVVNNNSLKNDFRFGSFNSLIVSCNDANWKETVLNISFKAKAILITPSKTKGVIEEFKMIHKNDLFFKTIIYMPKSDKDNSYKNKWNNLRTELKTIGISLPQYNEKGMLYIPNRNFDIEREFLLDSLDQFIQFDTSFWKLLVQIMKNEIKNEDLEINKIVSGYNALEGYKII